MGRCGEGGGGRGHTFGVVPFLEGLPKVSAVEVHVSASGDLGLFPDKTRFALHGLPVPFNELGLPLIVDKAEGVYTESVLVTALVPPSTAP